MAFKKIVVICTLGLLMLSSLFAAQISVQAYAPDGTWEHLSLGGGTVRDIAIDPSNEKVMYAAVWLNTVYKTVDGGESWAFSGVGLELPFIEIVSIAIDPFNTNTIYAGGRQNYAAVVFKSTNAGATWTRFDTTIRNEDSSIFHIVVDPSTPGLVYAITRESRFYRSTNGGLDWTLSMTGFTGPFENNGLILNKSTIQASSLHACDILGHYRSTDSGLTWSPGGTFSCQAIAAEGMGSNILYAVGVVDKITRVFKSTDNGANWTVSYSFGYKLWSAVIAVDPVNPSTLYIGNDEGNTRLGKFYVSQNGGVSWTELSTGMVNPNVQTIEVLSGAPSKIWVGTGGGGVLMRASDGASWVPKNLGLSAGEVSEVAIQPDLTSTIYAATIGAGVSKSVDGGATWQECNQGLGWPDIRSLVMDPNNYQTLFAGTAQKGIFRSTDGCRTWQAVNTNLPTGYPIHDIEMPSAQPNHLYATAQNMVYKSTDSGATWAQSNATGVPAYGTAVDPFNQARMVAVADYGIRYTSDGWNTFAASSSQIDDYMTDALYNPGKEGLVYAYSRPGGGIYQSSDGGVNWTLDDYFTPSALQNVSAMAIDTADPARVFALSFKVISVSEDSGQTWAAETTNFPFRAVLRSMAIDPQKTGTRYLGTTSGMFIFKPAAVVVENKNFLPMIVR